MADANDKPLLATGAMANLSHGELSGVVGAFLFLAQQAEEFNAATCSMLLTFHDVDEDGSEDIDGRFVPEVTLKVRKA